MTQRIFAAAAFVALACGGETRDATTSEQTTAQRVTRGDTTIVHNSMARRKPLALIKEISIGKQDGAPEEMLTNISTVAITLDGGVILFDGGARQLRQYDSTGKFVRNIGRSGQGPGEYRQPTTAVVSSEGKLFVMDTRSRKVSVYSAGGDFLTTWPGPGADRGVIARGIQPDSNGNAFSMFTIPDTEFPDSLTVEGSKLSRSAAVRTTPEGKIIDTILAPRQHPVRTHLISVTEGSYVMKTEWAIPFEAGNASTFSPLGYFLTAQTSKYSIIGHMSRGKYFRIELDREPVILDEQERIDALTASRWELATMGNTAPTTLADIPKTKPFFRSIRATRDGRLWVQLRSPATRVALTPEKLANLAQGGVETAQVDRPTHEWVEPTSVDIFEPDGEFVGTIELPPRSSFAAANGNHVWLIMYDDMDVPTLVRYRVGAR